MDQTEITWKGETHTIPEWSKITKIPTEAIRWRYNSGWDPERTLTQRPRPRKKKRTLSCGATSLQDCLRCPYADCIAPATVKLEGE